MNHDTIRRYRAAIVTYYATAHRPYRELAADLARVRARQRNDLGDVHFPAAEAVADSRRVLVLGDPGSGKTTLLDRLSRDLATSGQGTPIFLPLRRYVTNLADAVEVQVRRFVPAATLDDLTDDHGNGVAFLLDGLDEVAPPLHERVTHDIMLLAERFPASQLVVTARTATHIALPPDWRIVELVPLSDAEVRQVLGSIAGEEAVRAVFAHPRLLDIARRPLFLHTIANVTRMGGDVRQYMLDAATGYFAWRGHSKSTLPLEIPVDAIGRALEVLAFEVVRTATLWIKRSTAESLLAADEALQQWDVAQSVFDTDTLQSDDERIRFTHLSYVEAYAAKYLRSSLRARNIPASDLRTAIESPYASDIFSSLFKLLTPAERSRLLEQVTTATLADLMRLAPGDVAEHLRASTSAPERGQTVVEALEAAQRVEQRGRSRRDVIVFAVHGFNTRGPWKNWLATLLNLETDGVRFIYAPWDYGVFRLGILNPFARRAKVAEFQAYFNSVLDTYGANRPDVCAVAHSFGTFIVGNSMLLFDEVRFDRIILLRSVLPRAFPWAKIPEKCTSVLNECGGSDRALLVARFVPGLGASGRAGFNTATGVVREHFNEFGEHSTVFGSRYMREKWIPFLRDGLL
ncbi:MAG: NACHT domain-containing protein [Thermoanaerobaculia bacterium]